jgi:hypothetical protein
MSLFVAALLVSAQATVDPQSAPAAEAASAASAPKKEKKICKVDDASSGSRMAKRICLTQEEWAQRSHNVTDSARAGFSGQAQDH